MGFYLRFCAKHTPTLIISVTKVSSMFTIDGCCEFLYKSCLLHEPGRHSQVNLFYVHNSPIQKCVDLWQWAFMTRVQPQKSLAHLIYIGYPGDPASAFRITRQRRQDRNRQRSQRAVLQCFVFGPTNVGKSALLNALIGRCVASIKAIAASQCAVSYNQAHHSPSLSPSPGLKQFLATAHCSQPRLLL